MGLRVEDNFRTSATFILGCKKEVLPINYLGLLLHTNKITVSNWEPVVNRIQRGLLFGRVPILSTTGRLTLIKSALASMPIYFMSLCVMLVTVKTKIEGIMRGFFCGVVKQKDDFLPKLPGLIFFFFLRRDVWL